MTEDADSTEQPLVLITGAAGSLGSALTRRLSKDYRVIGLDLEKADGIVAFDITDGSSVEAALDEIRQTHGDHLAAVIHLAAYLRLLRRGEPALQEVNVDGTRKLLRALQRFRVEQFVYSGTMLVHRPGAPGRADQRGPPVEPRLGLSDARRRGPKM